MRSVEQVFRIWKWTMVVVGLVTAVAAAFGQDQVLHTVGPLPAFEVVTIKPSQNGFGGWTFHPNALDMRGVTVQDMVMFAYAIGNSNQIEGGPSWVRSTRFDVHGVPGEGDIAVLQKLPHDDQNEQMRLRMQALLAQRLGLKVSFPKKELPVYMLILAKGGFKCPVGEKQPNFMLERSRYPMPPPPPPPPPPGSSPETRTMRTEPLHFNAKGWPLWFFLTLLRNNPSVGGRIVIDKTGLDGYYDCDLKWSPDGSDIPGPTFFTAVQEQLGLKFEPGKASVETVMIEQVDPPTEN